MTKGINKTKIGNSFMVQSGERIKVPMASIEQNPVNRLYKIIESFCCIPIDDSMVTLVKTSQNLTHIYIFELEKHS